MELKCLTRKRIWEVDCWSLDAAIAAAFDWRELINLLQGQGHQFDLNKPETLLELQAQCLIHEYCHSENPLSTRIEALMNDWHKKTLAQFDDWTSSQIAEYVLTLPFTDRSVYGGLFWGLGSESREGFDCIRRRFYQRYQIYSVRKLGEKTLDREGI